MAPAINMSVIEELLSLSDDGDASLLVDLIQMFLEDAPVKVNAIKTGFAKRDMHQIEKAAHSLKGSSGNLGATQVQEICDQLQQACRGSTTPEEVAALVGELEQPFALVLRELRALLDKHRA